MEPSTQQKKLRKLAKLEQAIEGDVTSVFSHVDEVENDLSNRIDEVDIKIQSVAEQIPAAPTEERLIELIKPLIPAPLKGAKGDDYVLTDTDKKEIAKSVEVPIVEKIVETVVEKTEVIHEQPIEIIKEVAVLDEDVLPKYGDKFRDGLELLEGDDRLDRKAIKGLEDYELVKQSAFTTRGGNGKGLLSQLNDVNVVNPTNGQSLEYNSSTQKWENSTDNNSLDLGNPNTWTVGQTFNDPDITKTPIAPASSSISFVLDPSGFLATGIYYQFYIYSYYFNGSSYAYDPIGIFTANTDPNDAQNYNLDISWSAGADSNGYLIYNFINGDWLDLGDTTSFTITPSTSWNGSGSFPTLTPNSLSEQGHPLWANKTQDWGTTDFNVLAMGLSGSNHLQFRWLYSGGTGAGALRFESDDGVLRTINANIYADNISVTNTLNGGNISGYIYPTTFGANYIAYGSSGGYITGGSMFTFDQSTTRMLLSNAGITPRSQLHMHYSTATAVNIQYTNSSTGSASTDGTTVGITAAGVFEINQKENQVMNFYTNNTVGMTINTSQQVLITGGTVSAPSLAIGGDADTGMYRWNATSNHLGFSAGGAVGLIVGYSNGSPYVSVSSDATRIGNVVKFNIGGTGNGTDSPILGIKNSSETTTGKNGGIFTQTRMTSRYLQTSQNIGQNDNSFGNPGVIQWTGWEYSDNTYTTLVTPTEFTGWSYQYYNGSVYKNLLRIHTAGVGIGMSNAASTPAASLQVNGPSVAAGTPGVEDVLIIGRNINSSVSFPQAATFAIGTYSTNSVVNGYGPDTRLDLKLKASSSDNFTSNVNVMTWLDTGAIGAGVTSPTAIIHLKAGTATASTAPLKFTTGTNLTTAEVGAMEYNNTFHVTNSDATRRHVVTAPNTTKVTAGAPYTNDGYVVVNIGGTNFKVMTTA